MVHRQGSGRIAQSGKTIYRDHGGGSAAGSGHRLSEHVGADVGRRRSALNDPGRAGRCAGRWRRTPGRGDRRRGSRVQKGGSIVGTQNTARRRRDEAGAIATPETVGEPSPAVAAPLAIVAPGNPFTLEPDALRIPPIRPPDSRESAAPAAVRLAAFARPGLSSCGGGLNAAAATEAEGFACEMDQAKGFGILPELRRDLHHHVILVQLRIHGGYLALPEGIVQGVVE